MVQVGLSELIRQAEGGGVEYKGTKAAEEFNYEEIQVALSEQQHSG